MTPPDKTIEAVVGEPVEWLSADALGYDGVAELIDLALSCIVNSGGDERATPLAKSDGRGAVDAETLEEIAADLRGKAAQVAGVWCPSKEMQMVRDAAAESMMHFAAKIDAALGASYDR